MLLKYPIIYNSLTFRLEFCFGRWLLSHLLMLHTNSIVETTVLYEEIDEVQDFKEDTISHKTSCYVDINVNFIHSLDVRNIRNNHRTVLVQATLYKKCEINHYNKYAFLSWPNKFRLKVYISISLQLLWYHKFCKTSFTLKGW